jgi:hypothetical protein
MDHQWASSPAEIFLLEDFLPSQFNFIFGRSGGAGS